MSYDTTKAFANIAPFRRFYCTSFSHQNVIAVKAANASLLPDLSIVFQIKIMLR